MSDLAQALPLRTAKSRSHFLTEVTVSRLRSTTYCLLVSVVSFILLIIVFHSLEDLSKTSPVFVTSGNLDLIRVYPEPNMTLLRSNVTVTLPRPTNTPNGTTSQKSVSLDHLGLSDIQNESKIFSAFDAEEFT
ncbi:hypothetical protein RRG08_034972 [Elysia crispata]|uniref:Uncharacterized protein n=1 Tax=Elysia crispata TaxID=231223 RepID=A0AAE0Y241_9GAST|nr:hypothetical protein RRG08_034972 [Elysia crispata]